MCANNSGLRVLAVILFATLVLLAGNASGQMREGRDLVFNEVGDFEAFKSKSAHTMMTAEESSSYLRHLEALDCFSARAILNTAFVRTYPEFVAVKTPKTPEDGKGNANYTYWVFYSFSVFREYGLCESIALFQEGEAELAAAGIQGEKYRDRSLEELTDDSRMPTDGRDSGIDGIVVHSGHDYPPALVKLAGLVRRGDLLDAGADVELFLLARACHLGHQCAKHEPRMSELKALLTADQQAAVAARVQMKQPYLFDIMEVGKVDSRPRPLP